MKRFALDSLMALMMLMWSNQSLFGQDGLKPTTEKWYTYWGLGIADLTYPSGVEGDLNDLENYPGVDRTQISIDMLGFYWHVTPTTIGGFIINGAADRFEMDSDYFQWNHYLYSFSMIHYLTPVFGSGPFIRGDVGLAKMVIQDSDGNSESSDSGYGGLVGAGYSFDLGGTRILLNVNYAYRYIEDDASKILSFSVGGLF